MSRHKAQGQKRPREPSYYNILGVPQDASADEIKARYKALVLKFHPDRESSILAREAMISINHAYEVLSDEKMRFVHDLCLKMAAVESCRGSHAKRLEYFGKIFNMRIAPLLILSAILISCLAGYLFVNSQSDANVIYPQFVQGNRHYFMASFHEAVLALPTCIPVIGIAWGLLAGFVVGFADKGLVMVLPGFQARVSGLVFDYAIITTILKLAAYQIGMYRSLALVIFIKRRHFSKLDKIYTQADIVLVVLLSIIAGYVEHAMVNASEAERIIVSCD